MKDVSRVLQEKELDIERVRKEIEALHLAIPLLAENRDWVEHGLASPLGFPHSIQLKITSDKKGKVRAP
jgi:hypothetical protein